MFRVNPTNILRATLATMLLSASFHLASSLFFAIRSGNADYVNMFNVIGVSWFFPALGSGALNAVFGIVFVILAGMVVYYLMQYHDAKQSKK